MIVRLFMPQFAPLVESGAKPHTVRPRPKRMPKVGEKISLRCWTGRPYRSKQRILRESVVTKVERIRMTAFDIFIDGAKLSDPQLDTFACADGFPHHDAMLDWFEEQHGLPFEGIVIHWGGAS